MRYERMEIMGFVVKVLGNEAIRRLGSFRAGR